MDSYLVRKVGSHKGAPQVYLDVEALADAGFAPGKTYNRTFNEDKRRIELTAQSNGNYVVCKKDRKGKTTPVIDINSAAALKPFEGMEAVRVVIEAGRILILPLASEANRLERLRRTRENLANGTVVTAGLSFGAGIMDHAAHAGLEEAGVDAQLAVAMEIDEDLINHAQEHNDIWRESTMGIAAPMQELVQDEAAMRRLPKVDVFCAGVPCSGASTAGRSSRKIAKMEDHPEVGHLMAPALMILTRIQPTVAVFENVVPYSDTASAQILRQYLRDSGYDVQEVTLDASDFGCLEARKRWFLIGTTRGIEMDLNSIVPTMRPVRTIADVLEPIGPDASDWRTFEYLKTKEVRDTEKGNGFAMQVVTPESTSCGVLRKGYAKNGSTDPLLSHPSDPTLLRPFTVVEHARIKEVPEHLVGDTSKTMGHALLGQSVAYKVVRSLFNRIGLSMVRWVEQGEQLVQQSTQYSLLRATG